MPYNDYSTKGRKQIHKAMKRRKEILHLRKEREKLFVTLYHEISKTTKLSQMQAYKQHGTTSCLSHSIAVAYYSLAVADWLSLSVDEQSLIRGALLHDYFLYDWHEKDKSHSLHGFRHPATSLSNAKRDTTINAIEEDMIKHHMFPLTPAPPRSKEALILCLVDKVCSMYELRKVERYQRLWRLVML